MIVNYTSLYLLCFFANNKIVSVADLWIGGQRGGDPNEDDPRGGDQYDCDPYD